MGGSVGCGWWLTVNLVFCFGPIISPYNFGFGLAPSRTIKTWNKLNYQYIINMSFKGI